MCMGYQSKPLVNAYTMARLESVNSLFDLVINRSLVHGMMFGFCVHKVKQKMDMSMKSLVSGTSSSIKHEGKEHLCCVDALGVVWVLEIPTLTLNQWFTD